MRRGPAGVVVRVGAAVALAIAVTAVAVFAGIPADRPFAAPTTGAPTQGASPAQGSPPARRTPEPTTTTAGVALTLMSFNILTSDPIIFGRNPEVPRRELEFGARAPGIAQQIRSADPDVVALQENFGSPFPHDLLVGRLPGYEWVNPSEQVTILVRRSRFLVLSRGYRGLHPTEKGFVSWAKLQDRATGASFWVFDVHLRAGRARDDALLRSVETDTLRAVMLRVNPGLAEPVVLLGDLNTFSGEQRPIFRDPLAKLGARGLVDAGTVAARDSSNISGADSIHGFSAVVSGVPRFKVVARTGARIDYVFVPRGTTVDSFGVLTGPKVSRTVVAGRKVYTWDGIVPSDHSPVVAHVVLKG